MLELAPARADAPETVPPHIAFSGAPGETIVGVDQVTVSHAITMTDHARPSTAAA